MDWIKPFGSDIKQKMTLGGKWKEKKEPYPAPSVPYEVDKARDSLLPKVKGNVRMDYPSYKPVEGPVKYD